MNVQGHYVHEADLEGEAGRPARSALPLSLRVRGRGLRGARPAARRLLGVHLVGRAKEQELKAGSLESRPGAGEAVFLAWALRARAS